MKKTRFLAGLCALVLLLGMVMIAPVTAETEQPTYHLSFNSSGEGEGITMDKSLFKFSGSLFGSDGVSAVAYTSGKGRSIQYQPSAMVPGWYTVSFWNPYTPTKAVIAEIYADEKTDTITPSVETVGWVELGSYYFSGSGAEYLKLSAAADATYARFADVKFEPAEAPVAEPFTGYENDYSEDNLAEHEVVSGDWSIADGKLTATVPSGTALLIDQVPNLPLNYEVSAEIVFSETKNSMAGVVFGAVDKNNFFLWRTKFNSSGGQLLEAYQFKDGEDILLFEVGYKWYDEGEADILSVRVEGQKLSFCLNGETRFTHTADVSLGAGVGYRSYRNTIVCDKISVQPIDGIQALPENALILDNEDQAYSESGSFESAEGIAGRDESGVRTVVGEDAMAIWASYPEATENYAVYYYNPIMQADPLNFSVATLNGYWRKTVEPSLLERAGWVKLMVVSATETTAVAIELTGESGFYADAVALVPTTEFANSQYSPTDGGSDTVAVLVNQIGYDNGTSMRATVPNAEDGTVFKVLRKEDDSVAYEGTVQGNIADFTGKLPCAEDTDFYIVCGDAKSYTFTVGENLIYRRSVENALKFMAETRHDTFLPADYSIAWRDSSQYSFELNSLVLQYMANPSYYDNMDLEIYEAESCKYEELRVQDEPAIVWLMQFAALHYYELGAEQGNDLHALIKEQLAYFLYVYPEISEYVSLETYEKIRDYTLSVWGTDVCTDELFYNTPEGTVHDLYALQTVFGGFKGTQPPAHSIVPNLFMYEIALRDGLGEEAAEKFFTAAYENCSWLIGDEFDLNDPFYNKGQRSAEQITIPALSYFLEKYPKRAPEGLAEAILDWALVTIARADNMWDMRMAVSMAAGDGQYTFHNPEKADEHLAQDYWTGAAYATADEQWDYLSGGAPKNEPGNIAGLQAVTYAAARVLNDTDIAERLKAVGVAAIDDLFGRNPSGRAAFYHFTRDFEGGDLGWYKQYQGGAGLLEGCTAVIDANAPEGCYPYNPEAYNTGYTEGWVTYNAAWNTSIAYLVADGVDLTVSTDKAKAGAEVTVTLVAPLNMDAAKRETGEVILTDADGNRTRLTVTENGLNSSEFIGTFTLPETGTVTVSYGSGLFENACKVTVDGALELNMANAVRLLRYIDGHKDTGLTEAMADINGDGKVRIFDAVRFMQLLNTAPIE